MSTAGIIRRGQKCLLRRVIAEDLEPYFRWYRDERVQRFLANPWWDPTLSCAEYQRFRFQRYLDHDPSGGVFTICDLSGNPVGLVNYFELIPELGSCEIGIAIGEVGRWRQGIALESLILLLDFLETDLSVRRVHAQILEENTASQALFVKVGFRPVGKALDGNYVFLKYDWESPDLNGDELL